MDGRKRASAGAQKLKRNSIQQPHFRQKEDEFGNEINNGELKTLVTKKKKKKVMFTKCHIDCPEEFF